MILTVPALLDQMAGRFADRTAVVTEDRRLTYAELVDEVDRASRALLARGVGPGDRVAVWLPNRVEIIVALLASQRIGAAVVPLNTRYRGPEARAVVERSRASALFLAGGFLGTDYRAMLDDPATGMPRSLHTIVDVGDGTGTMTWTEFLRCGDDVDDFAVRAAVDTVGPDTVADILFTSGTTGRPKGVMSAHRQSLAVAETWAQGADMTADDRYAIVNPFFHSFGYKAGILPSLLRGATIHPVQTFDADSLMELVQREHITVMPGAPTLFISLINHPRLEEFDLSSLRFATAGAASVPENLFEQMLQVLGFSRVAQAYGLTECVVATQSRPGEDPRHVAQTTGPAVAGLELRVVDPETGLDRPVGDDGEVLLRGDTVMLGYFEDPEATAEAIDEDGWLHTGDIGRLDEHGCLKITDRLKDMFTVGGFNVYPAEVENALAEHADVIDVAVVGVPDDRMGEVGRAFVVLREGVALDRNALTAHCRTHLANFKVPRDFVAEASLPRNAAGKVVKTDLDRAQLRRSSTIAIP